ncbi:MAG: hypothetical protein ACK5D8_07395 [Bacteroidota bacterium]|jgi:hypothetical protein
MKLYTFKKFINFDAETEYCNFLCKTSLNFDAASIDYPMEDLPELRIQATPRMPNQPFLYLRAFDPRKHYSYLDALGEYIPKAYMHHKPTFKLHTSHILSTAIQYQLFLLADGYGNKEHDKNLAEIYERVKLLVICHLSAHWFIQCSSGSYGPMMGRMRYKTKDEIFYHEALAQAIMLAGVNQSVSLNAIAMWMEGNQPDIYTAYLALKPSLQNILKVYHFLSQTKVQSFELLRQGIRCLENGCLSIDAVIDGFMLRPYQRELRKQSLGHVYGYLHKNRPDLKEKYEDYFIRLGF